MVECIGGMARFGSVRLQMGLSPISVSMCPCTALYNLGCSFSWEVYVERVVSI